MCTMMCLQILKMATLGNQAESNRIVEPATHEVQRTAHANMTAANPMTYGTSAGTKFDADNNSTTNYATPQGEKLLMVSSIIAPERREGRLIHICRKTTSSQSYT